MEKLVDGAIPIHEIYPEGSIEVCGFGYLLHSEDNYFIQVLFRKVENKDSSIIIKNINLKYLREIPISKIIRNQHHTIDYSSNQILEFIINTNNINRVHIKDAKELDKLILTKSTSSKWQYVIETTDTLSNKKIFIPETEVFRYFYATSNSMLYAVLRSNLKMLYDPDTTSFNQESNTVILHLHDFANSNDAKRIARFIFNPQANANWHDIRRGISAEGNLIKKHYEDRGWNMSTNKTSIRASFPTQEKFCIKARCVLLESGAYFIQQIISDQSSFIGDKIFMIYNAETKSNNTEAKQPEKIKPDYSASDINKVTDETPHSSNSEVVIAYRDDTIKPHEVNAKKIEVEHHIQIVKNNEKSPVNIIDTQEVERASANSSRNNGNKDVVTASIQDDLQVKSADNKSTDLEDFIKVMNICKEKLKDIEINISKEHDMPKTQYKTKGKLALSYKHPNISRQYIYATLKNNSSGKTTIILELERDDKKLKSISTLILLKTNSESQNNKIIYQIVDKIVKHGKIWPKLNSPSILKYKLLAHPKKTDKIEHDKWASRIIAKINSLII